MPDKIRPTCACRRLRRSSCPSSLNGHADSPLLLLWCRELSSIIGVKPGDPDTGSAPSDPARTAAAGRVPATGCAGRPRVPCWPASPARTTPRWRTTRSVSSCATAADLPAAIAELKKGLRLARASGRPEREVDVQATLGAALAWTGRSQQGLAVLDRAVAPRAATWPAACSCGAPASSVDLGRFHEAHQDLSRALPYFRRDRRHGMGGPVADPSSRRSSSGSACPGVRPRTTPGPRRCSPPAGRNSSTPRPGITAGWWR